MRLSFDPDEGIMQHGLFRIVQAEVKDDDNFLSCIIQVNPSLQLLSVKRYVLSMTSIASAKF